MVQGYFLDSLLTNVGYRVNNMTGNMLKKPLNFMLGFLPKIDIPEVIPGVHLPKDELLPRKLLETILDFNPFSNYVFVFDFAIHQQAIIDELNGKEKFEALANISERIQHEFLGVNDVQPGYKFAGGTDRLHHLCLLLKMNPFFSFALTKSKKHDGFEVIMFDPEETNPTLYLRLMRTLSGVGHRVNFEFTSDLKYKSHSVYDDVSGVKIENPELTVQDYACAIIYDIAFCASCVHATFHVLHFVMTAAFATSAESFREMYQLADDYDNNIGIKYLEVFASLISDAEPDPKKMDVKVITGPDGFGSSQAVRPILKEMLDFWAQNPTAEGFLSGMMNISEEEMLKAGILTEFRKHYRMIPSFAKDLCDAFKAIDTVKFELVQFKLGEYLDKCGALKSNINTMQRWLELMNVTALTHASTLSYSRLIASADVIRWRNIQSDTFDYGDATLIGVGVGTIVGADPDHYMMSSKLHKEGAFGRIQGKYADPVQRVFDEYDAKAQQLKKNYEMSIINLPNFNEDGFILTDWCPDMLDGKQLTLCTYF